MTRPQVGGRNPDGVFKGRRVHCLNRAVKKHVFLYIVVYFSVYFGVEDFFAESSFVLAVSISLPSVSDAVFTGHFLVHFFPFCSFHQVLSHLHAT